MKIKQIKEFDVNKIHDLLIQEKISIEVAECFKRAVKNRIS